MKATLQRVTCTAGARATGRVSVVVLLAVAFVGAELADVVVEEGGDIVIYEKNETHPQNATSAWLCVRPGGNFEGVCIKVEDETLGEKAEGCFHISRCSLSSAPWKLVAVEAKVVQDVSTTLFKVKYNLTIDNCVLTGDDDYNSENIARLSVSAIGASQWLHKACPDTTTGIPSSSPLSTLQIVMIVLGVVATAVLALVLGVVIWKQKQRRNTRPHLSGPEVHSLNPLPRDTRHSEDVAEDNLCV